MPNAVITTITDTSGNKIGIEIILNDISVLFNNVKKSVIKCHAVVELVMYENQDIGDILQINYTDRESDQLHYSMVDSIDGDTDINSTEILYQKLKNILRGL